MRSIIGSCLIMFVSFLSVSAGEKDTLFISGLNYKDGQPVSVQIANGKIVKIDYLQEEDNVPQLYIAPGFIDVQINGYMGIDFSSPELTVGEVRKAVKALWKEGVTSFFPTLTSNPHKLLKRNFAILSEAMVDPEIKGSISGFHLEGPYISPVQGYRGDHPAKHIRKPDWNEFVEYQKAAHGAIKLITVAPELEGAIPFITNCTANGIRVALGHHNGTATDIRDAVDAGASISTHLGNGCANEINRHHNPIWPQLANDRLIPSVIVDGYHLTREEVQTFYKVKGAENTILVSDAVDLAGMEPGEYKKGDVTFLLTPNVVKYPAENVLAGAASPIRLCVGNVMKFTGCNLADAIKMASTNVSDLFDIEGTGYMELGRKADLVLFSVEKGEVVVHKTLVSGDIVYQID